MEAADPQQDRNVEARVSELLPCPFCGDDPLAIIERNRTLVRCQGDDCPISPALERWADKCEDARFAAFAAWNRRPSQPPQNVEALIESARGYQMTPEEREQQRQSFARGNVAIDNVEAGDAAKGVGHYIDSIRCYWQAYRKANGDDEKIIEAFIRDLDRLALSATSSPSANATGEQKGEVGEMANDELAAEIRRHTSAIKSDSTNYGNLAHHYEAIGQTVADHETRFLAAASNAERLKVAEGLLSLFAKAYRTDTQVSRPWLNMLQQSVEEIERFLSPAPAQTPGDERIEP